MNPTQNKPAEHESQEPQPDSSIEKRDAKLVVSELHIQRPLPPEAKEEIRLAADYVNFHTRLE